MVVCDDLFIRDIQIRDLSFNTRECIGFVDQLLVELFIFSHDAQELCSGGRDLAAKGSLRLGHLLLDVALVQGCPFGAILVDHPVTIFFFNHDLLVTEFAGLLILWDVVRYLVQPRAYNLGVTSLSESRQMGGTEHGCIGHNRYFRKPMLCQKSLDDR